MAELDQQLTDYPITTLDTPEERENVSGNSPAEDEALELVGQWWELDEDAKAAILAEFEQIYLMQTSKHWDMDNPATGRPLRRYADKRAQPNAVENVAFSLIDGLKSEFAQDVELTDYPQSANDEAAAKRMTEIKRHILEKNGFATHYSRWKHYFAWYGTAVWAIRWDPDWRGGRGPDQWVGDVRVECIHPALVYPDARCGENIQDGYRLHKAVWRSLEYIREHYPERGHLVVDTTKQEDFATGEENAAPEGMARVIETWYMGKPLLPSPDGQADDEVGLHVLWWVADQNLYLRHENFMYFEPSETPQFPFVFATDIPRENSPWGYGAGHLLLNPQIMLNKLSDLALQGLGLQALGWTYATPQAVSPKQQDRIERYAAVPGFWFIVDRPEEIVHKAGAGIPASLLNEMQRRTRHMEGLVGRQDITQGRTPGTVSAFRALQLLAERSAVRLKPKETSIQEALCDVSRWIGRMVMLYWDEPRAYRLMGEEDKPAFGMFRPDDMWRAWNRTTGDVVERRAFTPRPEMIEGQDYEYFWPEFDSRCEVSKAVPTDRFFIMELARDMVGAKIWPPEVLHYAVEQGRLPPWKQIREKVERQFGQAQPAAFPRAPEAAGMEEVLAMLPPQAQQQIAALPPEVQQQVVQEVLAAVQAQGGAQAPAGGVPVAPRGA